MTFKDRMQVAYPHAEEDLFVEFQRRGLTRYLVSLGTTILIMKVGSQRKVIIANKESVTTQLISKAELFTVPDFSFLRNNRLIVYLDGPVHKRRGVHNRDDHIDEELSRFGFQIERFSYTPPLSQTRKTEICNRIQELLA
jgi:hypothetical protein